MKNKNHQDFKNVLLDMFIHYPVSFGLQFQET